MPMCSVVLLTLLLQKLSLDKAPGPDFISAEHLLHAGESLCFFLVYCALCFFSVYCLLCVLSTASYLIPA